MHILDSSVEAQSWDHTPPVSADFILITVPSPLAMDSIVPIFQTEKLESQGGKATFLNLQNFQVSGLGWPGSTLGFFHWDTWQSAWQTGQSKMQSKGQYDALTVPGDSSLASREVFLETSLSGIFQFRHMSLLGRERAMGLWVGGFFYLGVQEKPV